MASCPSCSIKAGSSRGRISDLPDPDADMGAMLLRQALWRIYDDCGDGTAAAALIYQSIFQDGLRYITAGGDAMRLREHLLAGMRIVLAPARRHDPADNRQPIARPAGGMRLP